MFTSMLIILIKWNDHENRPILSYAILLHNRTFLKLKLIFDISTSVCKRASILKIPGTFYKPINNHDWLV